jgi:predicted lipoprotein with Yx(FWY)xxD motif
MPRPSNPDRARRRRWAAAPLGIAVVGLMAVAVAAMAAAGSLALRVARSVHVTNAPTKAFRVKPIDAREAVAVGPAGYAVYTFQGETTRHLICRKTTDPRTNCWAFWPPVSVKSAGGLAKQSGIGGKLGTFRNHGTLQLTLNGQPLYYFTPDIKSGNKGQAVGDELKTFGSIWHIVKAAGPAHAAPAPAATTTSSTSPYGY